jgi:hypothetical protein
MFVTEMELMVWDDGCRLNERRNEMSYKYFCYDPDTGFDTYKTAEEAMQAADDAISYYRDNADEGWNEEVSGVCWGELKQHTVVTLELTPKQADEQGYFVPSGCSGFSDYGLIDVK